jgi:hypothetical protein
MIPVRFPQSDFAWIEDDDRFKFGLCLTLVQTTDTGAVFAEFDAVNPRTSRRSADESTADWINSLNRRDGEAKRYGGKSGDWSWILEELSISGILPPLHEQLSSLFRTSITVQWDVNLLSTFVFAQHGVVQRQFELGREADPSDRTSLDGYLDEEQGLDWELWMAAGLCLQARLAGTVALTEHSIEPAIVEACGL